MLSIYNMITLKDAYSKSLNEVLSGLVRFLKSPESPVSRWPDYVIQQLPYNVISDAGKSAPIALDGIKSWFKQDYGYDDLREVHWKKRTVNIKGLDSFERWTAGRLELRMRNPEYGESTFPKDKERLQTQSQFVKKLGSNAPMKEPLIMVQHPDGKYELLEGWHRTITFLQAFPNGFRASAYIVRSRK